MHYAHDSEVALVAAAALVNSLQADRDELSTIEELDEFWGRYEYTGRRDGTTAELHALVALRPRLRPLWSQEKTSVVALVNDLLREHDALPQLVRHGDWDWHVHATSAESPLADRVAVETAMAMIDVIRAGELDRLRICTAADCDDVVVDLSRNRSKRYCDHGCGNRANVAAYRARRADR